MSVLRLCRSLTPSLYRNSTLINSKSRKLLITECVTTKYTTTLSPPLCLHTTSIIWNNSKKNKIPKPLKPPPTSATPALPDLIYVPHILRWLKIKIRFKYLQKIWDPEFSEGAFIYGTTHAISKITQIISDGTLDELDNLMTKVAKFRLLGDLNHLTKAQKAVIKLKPEDIKILIPLEVQFSNKLERHCRIDLRALALKWHQHTNGLYRLVVVAIQTEFFRNYSPHVKQEWTICNFNILECSTISEVRH